MVTAAAGKLIHYDSKTCPFAQRAWITLLEKKLPFELRQVDLENKSKEFQELYSSIHPDPAAGAKVPILIDGDTNLVESQIVVEYLSSKYASEGPALLPSDPAAAARARLFAEVFSSAVTGPTFALLRADTAEGVAAGKEKLAAGLEVVNTALKRHGSEEGGDYFLGGEFTIGDILTLTFLQRAIATLPVHRDVDVWALIKERKLERLERWAHAVLERPSAKETKPADDVIAKGYSKFVSPLK